MRRSFSFLLFFFVFFGTSAQRITNPPSVKWKKIDSEHFRVVFPTETYKDANELVNTLEKIYHPLSNTVGKSADKITVILQNQNTTSNAFVTGLPRHSEFYSTPPQQYTFLGNNDWLDLLAIHEFRHVVQIDKALSGFPRFMKYLFGQSGAWFLTSSSVPSWYWEGDAVVAETAYTNSGRGRLPSFDIQYKANLLERKPIDYNTQYLRSLKYPIPNHYRTGYFLVSYLREKHGKDVWNKITDRAFAKSYLPFVFAGSVKKITGSNLRTTYADMAKALKVKYQNQVNSLELTAYQKLNARKSKIFTSYLFPQPVDAQHTIVMKTSWDKIPQIVEIDSAENERIIQNPGVLANIDAYISSNSEYLIWTEQTQDLRWQQRSYSDIVLLDHKTGKKKKITHRKKYFGAGISPNGLSIITLERNDSLSNKITVLNPKGEKIKQLKNPDNSFYSMLRFTDNSNEIIGLKHDKFKKEIVLIDIISEQEKSIITSIGDNIGHPVKYGNYVIYGSDRDGVDNIYLYDLTTEETYRITSAKYGAYNPALSPDGKYLYYNNSTLYGQDVVKILIKKENWTPVENSNNYSIGSHKIIADQENNSDILKKVDSTQYNATPYKKMFSEFHLASRGILQSSRPNRLVIGAQFIDIMNYWNLSAGHTFRLAESTGSTFSSITFGGFFPELTLGAVNETRSTRFDRWKQHGANFQVTIPLNLTGGNYARRLSISSTTRFRSVTGKQTLIGLTDQGNGSLFSQRYTLSFSNLLSRAVWDTRTRFGQRISINYDHTPYGGDFTTRRFSALGTFYFPSPLRPLSSVFANHSLAVVAGIQYQKAVNFLLPTTFFFARGYSRRHFEQVASYSANYIFPLVYPDFNVGPFVNFRRLSTGAFIDYSKASDRLFLDEGSTNRTLFVSNNEQPSFISYGGQLVFDLNFFRTLFDFRLVFRAGYAPGNKSRFYQLSFSDLF